MQSLEYFTSLAGFCSSSSLLCFWIPSAMVVIIVWYMETLLKVTMSRKNQAWCRAKLMAYLKYLIASSIQDSSIRKGEAKT